MKDVTKSVKQVMVVYLFCFVALISYIAYFQLFKAPALADSSSNKRIAAVKNEVLRGTIYDRDKNALTSSKRIDATSQQRTYLQGNLFCHPLGFSSSRYGTRGLEKVYDKELSTYSTLSNNFNSLINDFSMDKLKSLFKTRKEDEEKIGNGVVTTLNTNLQKAALDALQGRKGTVVALNPQTGEILAMISNPLYDPNKVDSADNLQDAITINKATTGMYPPGSTFKTVTVSSALQNIPGVTNETFIDGGKITFKDGSTLNNYGNQPNGSINLEQGFVASSNYVFGTLAMRLGNSKLKATAESFGFNNSIDGNGIVVENSVFPELKSYEEGSIAQSGIGQSSILATPMQMAVVASTVANNGKQMELTLVKEIVDKDKQVVKTIDPKVKNQVLDAKTASTVKGYMKALVDSKSGDNWANLKACNAAGKTGTADYNDSTGKAATPHSWFIGFAPADNPQIAVAVIIENGGTGAESAAPTAGRVMRAALNK